MILKEILGSKMYLLEDDVGLSKDLMENKIREKASTEYIKSILKSNWTVIDIGANLGYYALLEAKLAKSVYAIEPIKISFDTLNKSIEINNYKNIKTYNLAIGSQNGIQDIIISKKINWSTMVDPNITIDKYKQSFNEFYKNTKKIKTLTLDNFVRKNKINKINFVRMDVEGYEVEIIKGTDYTFSLMPAGSFLTIEFHSILYKDSSPFIGMLDKIIKAGFKAICGTWNESTYNLTNENLRDRLCNRGVCLQVFFRKDGK